MSENTPNLQPATVTCHTEGCENCNIPIVIDCDPDGIVMCGPCGNLISDIVYEVI